MSDTVEHPKSSQCLLVAWKLEEIREKKSNYHKKRTKTKCSHKIGKNSALLVKILNSKTCFRNVLTETLPDQHRKIPVNRKTAFISYFIYENEQQQFQD